MNLQNCRDSSLAQNPDHLSARRQILSFEALRPREPFTNHLGHIDMARCERVGQRGSNRSLGALFDLQPKSSCFAPRTAALHETTF